MSMVAIALGIPNKLLRDSRGAARADNLRHVSLDEAGFSRVRRAKHFHYRTSGGVRVTGARQLGRIAALAIPPERTSIRIGNDEYASHNNSYGLTTLLDRDARILSSGVEFRFRGKSGKPHAIAVADRKLATIVKRYRDIFPGSGFFNMSTTAASTGRSPRPTASRFAGREQARSAAGHQRRLQAPGKHASDLSQELEPSAVCEAHLAGEQRGLFRAARDCSAANTLWAECR